MKLFVPIFFEIFDVFRNENLMLYSGITVGEIINIGLFHQ